MASSDHRQTHIAQPEADDEQWTLLEHRGDTVNEQLHEKQDGDVKREVGSIPDTNEEWLSADDMEKLLRWCRYDAVFKVGVKDIVKKAAKRLESAQDTEKYFWSWRSAWNDTFAHDAGWGGHTSIRRHCHPPFAHSSPGDAPRRGLPWLLQLLADTWRVYVLTAAVLMCATLVVGMVIDFHVLTSASFLHTLVMAQYRRLASHRRLKRRAE
ncbi:hypothetical protein MRX96_056703 [Rhipicephalus microplus]